MIEPVTINADEQVPFAPEWGWSNGRNYAYGYWTRKGRKVFYLSLLPHETLRWRSQRPTKPSTKALPWTHVADPAECFTPAECLVIDALLMEDLL